MKTRISYVSNSSSSSFILYDDALHPENPFNALLKRDLLNAITMHYVSDRMSFCNDRPFDVFDLSDPEERDAAIDEQSWYSGYASLTAVKDGKHGVVRSTEWSNPHDRMVSSQFHRWDDGIRKIEDWYARRGNVDFLMLGGWSSWPVPQDCLAIYDNCGNKTFISRYHQRKIDRLWKECGLCSRMDALQSPRSRLLVKFDSNEILCFDKIGNAEGKYRFAPYSYERSIEIIAIELIESGAVDARATVDDFFDTILDCEMHEG